MWSHICGQTVWELVNFTGWWQFFVTVNCMNQNKVYGWVKVFRGAPKCVGDAMWATVDCWRIGWSNVQDTRTISIHEITPEASVNRGKRRRRNLRKPSEASYSDVIKELVRRWTKFVESWRDYTDKCTLITLYFCRNLRYWFLHICMCYAQSVNLFAWFVRMRLYCKIGEFGLSHIIVLNEEFGV
jgi:hypothetical protein